MNHFYNKIKTPVGELTLIANEQALCMIFWQKDVAESAQAIDQYAAIEKNNHPILMKAEKQLNEYFGGQRTEFDVPLDARGTEFQKKVWQALQTIPFGETRSYGQLAKQLKKPSASRAVGMANGRNPLSIIVPCHRVIGANGTLTGFGGGLEAKAHLLRHEGINFKD